jgi:hypothetical protein
MIGAWLTAVDEPSAGCEVIADVPGDAVYPDSWFADDEVCAGIGSTWQPAATARGVTEPADRLWITAQ